MSKRHYLTLFLIACAPMLASCSTMTNGSTQQVAFKTVGADDAYCTVSSGANDYRYSVRPPQTIWVQRSRQPMLIDCTAPGNRTLSMSVESTIANSSLLNGVTAGATLAWDASTGAMYEYPNEITIDFTTVTAKNQPLPSYENRGALDSTAQGMEYLGTDTPKLPGDKAVADRYKAAYAESDRLDAEDTANEIEKQRRIDSLDGGFYGDKGGAKPTPSNKSDEHVQISPLSEAAPSMNKTTAQVDSTMVPHANPQLGKPIFPTSTTF